MTAHDLATLLLLAMTTLAAITVASVVPPLWRALRAGNPVGPVVEEHTYGPCDALGDWWIGPDETPHPALEAEWAAIDEATR